MWFCSWCFLCWCWSVMAKLKCRVCDWLRALLINVWALVVRWYHGYTSKPEQHCDAPSTPALQARRLAERGGFRSLFLLRHGERIDHVDPAWCTAQLMKSGMVRSDPMLSTCGRLQAIETALYVRNERLKQQEQRKPVSEESAFASPVQLRSSPALRCLETSAVIALLGFDGSVHWTVDGTIGDFQSVKLYPNGAPQYCERPASAGEGSSRELLCHPMVRQTVLRAIDELSHNVQLLKRHRVKEKHLARWRAAATQPPPAASYKVNGEAFVLPLTAHGGPTYPEGDQQLRRRCATLFGTLDAGTTLCVTHADVVRACLEVELPRTGHRFAGGFSVPYCSVTHMTFHTPSSSTSSDAVVGARARHRLPLVGSTAHLMQSEVRLAFL